MAYSFVQYTANGGTGPYSVTFPYITKSHVKVRVDGVLKTITTDYTWPTDSTIQFVSGVTNGLTIDIRRESSPTERMTDHQDAGTLTEQTLDGDGLQLFYLAQEAFDAGDAALSRASDNTFDAESRRIKNVADPSAAQDAVTKAYADANYGGTSATNAAASADAAAASAAAAADSEGASAASASAAADSETAAAASESAAAASAAQLSDRAFAIAIGDETEVITTGTAKVTFRMPYGFTLNTSPLGVRASLTTVSSSGVVTVDINVSGSSILSTKLTIDASEKTSTTAATPAVISGAAIADDAEVTIDIDTAGTGAVGLKVYLIGNPT